MSSDGLGLSALEGPANDSLRDGEAGSVHRTIFKRAGILTTVLSLYLGIPYGLFLLGLAYILENSTLNLILGLWVLSAILPALPTTGIIAAIAGTFSKDRVVGFLLGLLPVLVLLVLVSAIGGFAPRGEQILPWGYGVVLLLRLLIIGLGFGLMGLGGALYGEWKDKRDTTGQRTLRLSVLAIIIGSSLWLVAAWGTPVA